MMWSDVIPLKDGWEKFISASYLHKQFSQNGLELQSFKASWNANRVIFVASTSVKIFYILIKADFIQKHERSCQLD